VEFIKYVSQKRPQTEHCYGEHRADLSRHAVQQQQRNDIVKLLYPTGSLIILVFDPEHWYPIPGNPFSGGAKTRDGKNLRFSTEIAVYLGNGRR